MLFYHEYFVKLLYYSCIFYPNSNFQIKTQFWPNFTNNKRIHTFRKGKNENRGSLRGKKRDRERRRGNRERREGKEVVVPCTLIAAIPWSPPWCRLNRDEGEVSREIDRDVHVIRPRPCHALPPSPLVPLPSSLKEKGRATLRERERLTEANEAHERREADSVTAAVPSRRH